MSRAITVLYCVLLLLSGSGCRSTHDPRVSWTVAEGYEYLIVARRFSLGGVGPAATTPTSEYAFRAVLRAPEPKWVFELILSPGAQATEEGKLYALCGIRAVAPDDFEKYAAQVRSTNAEVVTQSGCVVFRRRAVDVVERIAAGHYDIYFVKK